MAELKLDSSKIVGVIKPMHAVNNGPIRARNDQSRGNFDAYKAARIPFARNHDASHCATYGGPHCVDVANIFRDFNADPEDPANYDFLLTDILVQNTLDAGTETYYRLGASIEHWAKKYNTLPPPDFKKWAVICEHIIAHYNEGWADGHHHNIQYWEIWNEPDLDPDDSTNKRCWGGTAAEFYELFKITATHLKARFPNVKIGGPALAWRVGDWMDNFLAALTKDGEKTPMDFFSWHIYCIQPQQILDRAKIVREKLDAAGYTEAESILNEWNYVKGWGKEWFQYSVNTIHNLKGGAFTMSCMLASQNSSIDLLMYYDARPTPGFCGLFNIYDFSPMKPYYAFPMFADLYDLKNQVSCETDDPDVYAIAAKGEDGTLKTVVCYYQEDDEVKDAKTVILTDVAGDLTGMTCKIVDETRNLEDYEVKVSGNTVEIVLTPNSYVLLSK